MKNVRYFCSALFYEFFICFLFVGAFRVRDPLFRDIKSFTGTFFYYTKIKLVLTAECITIRQTGSLDIKKEV